MRSQLLIAVACLFASSLSVTVLPGSAATQSMVGRFGGIEYYGSSLLSRLELEKLLGIKLGATATSTTAAVERLKKQLASRNLESNVQMVVGDGDEIIIAVDVIEPQREIPSRKLKNPQHVPFRSETPVQLLEKIHERLEQLNQEQRPVSEKYKEGIRYFTDEPCNQYVNEILEWVPGMTEELLGVVEHDPNSIRRKIAVELLNWSGSVTEISARLIPVLDDSDVSVRIEADRFLFPRLDLLPPDFPFDELAEAFSRQLSRPSHQDRSKALYSLLALVRLHPELAEPVNQLNEERIKRLVEETRLRTIKAAGEQLLKAFADAKRPKNPVDSLFPLPGEQDSIFPHP